jgi:hypothetical protein
MEDAMARPNLCSNSVPKVELDHRARDPRLRLVRIEQLLVSRAAGKGFRLLRLFGWGLYRQPKRDRTSGSLSKPRSGCMPEIDSARFGGCGVFRGVLTTALG